MEAGARDQGQFEGGGEAARGAAAAAPKAPAGVSALERSQLRVKRLEAQLAQQDETLDWLRRELNLRERQLEAVESSRWWQVGQRYQRVIGAYDRGLRLFRAGPRASLVYCLRRLLPLRAKQLLKRLWDPRRRLSAGESAALDDVATRAATQAFAPVSLAPHGVAARLGAPVSPVPLPTRYDVVCFSIIDWEFRWQRPQQLMSQFADAGHRVFFISPSRFTDSATEPFRLRRLRDNVWEVQLFTPRPFDIYAGVLPAETRERLVEGLRALREAENLTCAVSVVQMATWAGSALAARAALGWHVVYDCMDEWNTFPGIRSELLDQEERLVRAADLLVVSAQRLLEKWSGANPNTVLARNATDFEHFHRPVTTPVLRDVAGPVVGYFGAIAEWFDLDLMERLARARPNYTFVLLGGVFGTDTAALSRLPNVRLLGQRPYAEMPAYLQRFDVCLIPFKVNAVTEATDPVKFYEYVSQGKPVVATRMPELYPYRDYCAIAADADDFIRQVDRVLAEADPELRARRIELARENTWQQRLGVIAGGIRAAHRRASVIVVTYNNLDYTRLCLDSLLRHTLHPNHEIIVVDNASADGTPDYLDALAAEQTHVRVILNRENRGFAAANNQGLAAASGDDLVLLNNDTVVPNGWLMRLLRHLERPQIGLVVAVTNFSGNESRVEVPYQELSGLEAFAAARAWAHEGEVFDIRVAAMYCVALRRETLEVVGPLDEGFGLGMFEDDDYSHRVRRAGLRVVCAEDAFVHHFGQSSFKRLSPEEYQAIWDRNQARFESKWGVAWEPHRPRAG